MYLALYISSLILGLLIGSFLNVVIIRYNTGGGVKGRSRCTSCARTLAWYELVPVASYVMLKGRCRTCSSGIALQYPLVELATGVLFTIVSYTLFSPAHGMFSPHIFVAIATLLFYFLIISLLIIITVYDIRHMIIPDGIVYALCIAAAAKLLITHAGSMGGVLFALDALAGPLLFSGFFFVWFLSKGRWMGFGDAKLALAIGWLLGFKEGISAVVLAFWLGAALSLIYIGVKKLPLFLAGKQLTIKSEIPFAPYLILGTLFALFSNLDVLQIGALLGI
jgi:leader peptidase (prepilin peptidase) / N-methyltransferase